VLERGRAKVAEALVGGKAILIGGGQYRVATCLDTRPGTE
jgi:predicted DNA-binding protein (UPF0251 family)